MKQPQRVHWNSDKDIVRVVREVAEDGEPRAIERDGETVAVLLSPDDFADLNAGTVGQPWAGYDPDRARRALEAATGALTGVDTEALQSDLRAQRGQDSSGRPV
ncbi:MAG: hypothetical protein HY873_02740 [Chloroflexi bacterium]|nr:hypothetical protein [Chloroflexota bacterium]